MLLTCILYLLSASPSAAQNKAGTSIDNRATLVYMTDGATHEVVSNSVHLLVAERLDVTLALVATTPASGDRTVLVRTDVTNTGNGPEAFLLGTPTGGGTIITLAVDSDGDGQVGDTDARLTDHTAVLAPGESLPLLALVTVPDTEITLEARATTGSGAPGTAFDAQGEDGSDAVVGPTGARATVVVPVASVVPAPQLIKTQSVAAPDGGQTAVIGATITYSLEARFAGPASSVRIDDEVPAGTRFVPGSITLDGRPLSDTVGDDAGSFDGTRVSVAVGDVSGPANRLIRFQAIIP